MKVSANTTESAKILQKRISGAQPEPLFLPLDPLWLSCKSDLSYTAEGQATGIAEWNEENGSGAVRIRTKGRLREMRQCGGIHDGLPTGKLAEQKKEETAVTFNGYIPPLKVNDRFAVVRLPEPRSKKEPMSIKSWEDPEVWATRAKQGASRLALVGSGVPRQGKYLAQSLQRSQSATTMLRHKEHSTAELLDVQNSHREFARLVGPPSGQPGPFTGFQRCASGTWRPHGTPETGV